MTRDESDSGLDWGPVSDRPRVIKRMREHDAKCWPIIADGLDGGVPLSGIVRRLVSSSIAPPQGKYWHEKAVRRIIVRHQRRDREHRGILLARKKFLLGEVVLAQIDKGILREDAVRAGVDEFLTEDKDRALFDLPPKR